MWLPKYDVGGAAKVPGASAAPDWLLDDLLKFVKNQHIAERAAAESRQRKIAAELGRDRKSSRALGRPRLEVDSYSYHYWGQRLGYKCWKDKQFIREFERDNPHARVAAKGVHNGASIGWTTAVGGLVMPHTGQKRFSKKYE